MTTFRTRPAVTGRAERDVRAAGDPEPPPPDHPLLPILGRHAAPREPPSAASGRWFMLAWLLAFIILAASATGRTIFDTKLGVDIDPAGFYARLWHLWNPQEWFGTLQDQYIGYAIPMAPFYLAGQLLHLPVWITERLWLSLLVALGFWGMVRLATALRIGSQSSRLLAGAIYALWPTFTIVLGSTSAAVLPGILVPWALLPLVTGAARDSAAHDIATAARSGAVVLCMGGVNAVSTIDALVLPALYIVTHTRGKRRVSLSLWWSAAVAAATSWWMIPLLIQNGYSFNFLPYVEQAATTTKTMSATAFLRGTGNWTAYFDLGGPWLSAGWNIVTTPLAVLATALAAGAGLAGLARRDMPEARWLRLSVALAALGALAGYWGPLGGVFHTPILNLLNGAFAPFRNVYKLEPVVAVAVTLGLAHAAGRWWQRRITVPRMPRQIASGLATAPVTAFVLAGLALPYLSGQILQPGSFTNVPRYWSQAADFLAAHSHNAPALLVPADAHGTYLWGNPIDDPLEPLARSPWVERGLVPYGGAGSQTVLVTAENAIESGEQVTGLTTYLQRAGIRYVVVRNDLSPATVGYTPPQVVHETLSLSGFRRVAGFGPLITGEQTDPHASPQIRSVLPSYQAVEIYEAASTAQQPDGPATVLALSQATLVNGGPDSLLQLAGQHLLGTQPAVVAGDAAGTQPSRWLVTDGMRRADNAFGLINSNTSYTYTATERNPPDDPFGGSGGPPRQLLPVTSGGQQSQRSHQTVAVFSGAAGVTASSYGSWLAEAPHYDPANAFDGNPNTAWTEGDPNTPTGQWIQITFNQALDLPGSIGIRLLDDSSSRAIADRVQVSTAVGQVSTVVSPSNNTQQVQVTPGRTAWLRVTITGARRVTPGGAGAGVRDVLIPGVRVARYLQPPETAPSGLTAPIAYSFHQQVPSPSTLASPAADPPLARTFTTPGPQTLRVRGSALALPGAALDSALDQLAPAKKSVLNVTASSTWGSLPQFGPASLFTAVGGTAWVSGSPNPVIHLSWHGNRRIGRMVLAPAFGISAAPESVRVTSPNGTREANIGTDGVVQFVPALTTDRIDVTFPQIQSLATVNSYTGQLVPLTVGLSRLQIPALKGLRLAVPDSAKRFKLACGQGPGLTIDGKSYQTAVSGTVGDLTQFLPVHVTLCTPHGTLDLGQGRHWLTASAAGLFTTTDVSLTAGTAAAGSAGSASAGGTARVIDVFSWQPEKRQLGIGPGPASYLEVHENANPGWVATLDGRPLKSVRLDGWQQGFVVPAGQGGIITLTFPPATLYHVALALSALGVIALIGAAIRGKPRRPHRQRASPAGSSAGTRWGRFAGSGGTSAQSWGWFGETGTGAQTGMGTWSSGAGPWLAVLAVTVLIFVIGGPVALAVPVIAIIARWSPRWLPFLAFVAMLVAGLLAATAAQPTVLGSGAFSAPAQVCALIALAAVLTPQISGLPRWRLPGGLNRGEPKRRGPKPGRKPSDPKPGPNPGPSPGSPEPGGWGHGGLDPIGRGPGGLGHGDGDRGDRDRGDRGWTDRGGGENR